MEVFHEKFLERFREGILKIILKEFLTQTTKNVLVELSKENFEFVKGIIRGIPERILSSTMCTTEMLLIEGDCKTFLKKKQSNFQLTSHINSSTK